MRKLLLSAILMLLAITLLTANAIPGQNVNRPRFAPDKVKIQLTKDAYDQTNIPEVMYAEAEAFGIEELDNLLAELSFNKIIRAHRKVKDTAWEQETGFDRWFLVSVPLGTDILRTLTYLKASPLIEQAIPEYYAYTLLVPNDTYYPNNWGHNNTAQLPVYQNGSHSGPGVGTIGFDSNAQAAWDDTQGLGSASVVIAIIDTGVDTAHPDLRLVAGYDYGDNDSNPMDNSADPGHGTACSGVAAGIGNNALGVAGVAGGCSVMPLKIADSAGNLGFTAIENALTHAGDYNVDVASMSFGAEGGMAEGDSPSTDAALEYAYSHGVVLLAATANSNAAAIAYPSNHNKVISVGASSPTGQRKSTTSSDGEYWWGSNYGINTMDAPLAVDIMAPTILPATDITGTGGYDPGNYSMWFNGTSCATPYAAGVAALLISKNPTLTPAQVRTALTTSATDMTIDGGAGWDRYTGYGLVNAQGALAAITPGMPSCTITAPVNGSTHNLGSTITVNVTATDSNGTIQRVEFFLDGAGAPSYTDYSSPYSWNWNTTGATGGSHTITAKAYDNESNMASSSITVILLAPANEGFETGNFSLYPWAQSGNANWVVQTSDIFSGTYAAKSGTILDSQSSSLDLTLNITSAGNISFYQKVSSEATYDFLRFYIDNVQQGEWSGAGAWTMQSYPVTTGSHNFKWTFAKDGSVASGTDAGYLDHIVFPPHNVPTPPTITWSPASFTQTLPTNQTASQNLTLGNTGTSNLTFTASLPSGNTTVLDETFATTSIPTGWTESLVSGTALSWAYVTGGYSSQPAAAYDGAYNARLYKASSTASVVKLITPSLDLSGSASATLTFWHTQANWSGDQDELRVYYRTSSGGAWTLLNTYTANITAWTLETITLPNINGTYYVAFEGTAKYGYGVCVDKVVVTKAGGGSTPWVTLNGGTSVSNTIAGGGNQVIAVGFNTTGMSDGVYNSTITVTSNSTTNSTVTIPVTLTVQSSSPQIVVNPTSLAYGTVMINTTTSQTFNIANAGNATLTGNITTPAGYTVALLARQTDRPEENTIWTNSETANERNTIAFSVPATSSRNYSVTFAPIAVLAYNGNVTITHNAGGGDRTVTLTGAGGKPVIGLSATTFTTNQAPGMTFNQTLTLSNTGNMTLNYALSVTGSPAWLNVNGASTYNGSIVSGGAAQNITIGYNTAAMVPGTYNAVIVCTSNDPVTPSQNINVTLTVRNPIVITAPTTGTSWPGGSLRNIVFGYSGAGTSVTWSYSLNGGTNWISGGSISVISGTNTYGWIVPNFPSANCLIKIVDSIAPNTEKISNVFAITAPSVPLLTVTSPNGGETWEIDQAYNITWTHNLLHPDVMLYYSLNNGPTWNHIATVAASAQSYAWNTPSTTSTQCLVRIVDAMDSYALDVSNSVFSLVIPAPPSTPDNVAVSYNASNGSVAISWNASTGNPTGYNVFFSESVDFTSYSLLAYVPAPQTGYTDPVAYMRPWGFYRIVAVRN
jgi:subtilisin family serine protease